MSKFLEREWWVTLITAVIGLLTTLGIIGPDQMPKVQAIAGVILIVGPALAFIILRQWAKIETLRASADVKVEQAKAEARIEEAKADVALARADVKIAEAQATPTP